MADATCEKCEEFYSDPRMLPCLHSFCLKCLDKELEKQGSKDTLQCPSCEEKVTLPVGGVSALPQDLRKAHESEIAHISSKVEDASEQCEHCGRSDCGQAIAFCVDCDEFLCKSCEEHHSKWRKTVKHTIVAAGERLSKGNEESTFSKFHQPQLPCPHHMDEVLKVYCMKCEKLICRDCMEFDHSDHRSECNRVETVATRAMESLRACTEGSQGAVATLDGAIAECKKTMQQVESRKKEVDNAITRSLEQVREALLAQNEEMRLKKITSLEGQVSKLTRIRKGLSHASDMISAAESHTPAQQLSTKKALAERATQLQQEFKASQLLPAESDTVLTAIASPDTIKKMIDIGHLSDAAHAASSTCDTDCVPKAVVGEEHKIKVTSRDKEGKLCPCGGEKVEASLRPKESQGPPIQGRSTDHGDGSYSVTFTAQSAGEHELHVTIGNGHVKGSPFKFQISGAHAASSTCDAGYVPKAVVGKERMVKVTARDKEGKPCGGEKVEASLRLKGSQDPPVQGRSTDHGDGSYSVTFTAQSAGEQELHVTIGNSHVKGSPFKYQARQPRKNTYTALSAQSNISTYANPFDVAVTEDGHLAVAEYGSHTVSLYNVDGQRIYSFGTSGSPGSADEQFYSPSAVAIRGDVMYVCEANNSRVQKFSISRRSFISKFGSNGSGDGQFSNPYGICIDPEGKVFVSDHSNQRIQVFQADGSFAYSFKCQQTPWGLAFDLQGRLHVAANGSNCIQVFSPDGTSLTSYGTGTVNSPAGIAIDAEGYIAVSEYGGNSHLWIYSPDHTLVKTLTSQFSNGIGIACDAEGRFWVADQSNTRIVQY